MLRGCAQQLTRALLFPASPLQPPVVNKGARPSITSAPASTFTGQQITVTYSHSNAGSDPVERALLIRTGSVTHSQAFGELRKLR